MMNRVSDALRDRVAAEFGFDSDQRAFDAMKGAPVRRLGRYHIDESGTLAKMPLINDDIEAAKFLEAMKESKPFIEVFEALVAYSKRASELLTSDIPPLEEEKAGEKVGLDCVHEDTSPPVSLSNLRNEQDTFRRASDACKLFRRLNRTSGFNDFWRWYQRVGLAIGNSDLACCHKAFEFASSRPLRTVFTPEQAEQLFESLEFSGSDLRYGGTRRLRKVQVVRLIHCMTTTLFKVHDDRWRQFTFAQKCGLESCKLNRDQYAAGRRLLLNRGVFVVLDNGYRPAGKMSGIAKRYGLGTAHPLFEEFEELRLSLAEGPAPDVAFRTDVAAPDDLNLAPVPPVA